MMRTILIPIEPGASQTVAMAHARRIAPLYKSRLLGLHVIDTQILQKGLEGTEEIRRLLEREAQQHLDAFTTDCQSMGLPSATDTVIGEPIEEISQYTGRADLLLVGESLQADNDEKEHQKRIDALLHRITRPLYLAREGHEGLERIVVGYDGSEKGGHALQTAADLAERASAELILATVASSKELETRLQEEASVYLGAFTVNWRSAPSEGHPGAALAKTAQDENADLVVVGAHGHGWIHEAAFGSTTRYLLEYVPTSLLIWR